MRTIKELLILLINEYQSIEGEPLQSTIYSDSGYAFGIITKKAVDKLLITANERDRLLDCLRANKTEYVNQFLWWPPKYLNASRIEFLTRLINSL